GAYPSSRFTGYDFSSEGIANAKKEAATKKLDNAHFEIKDVANLDQQQEYDLVTAFDAIHDQARPAEVLQGIAKALKPDGVFLMQDIAGSSFVEKNLAHPLGPFCYTISCMHCMTVSLAQGGDGLGAMWGEEKARAMLWDAGFKHIKVTCLPHDILNIYYVVTR
ncbi:MAG TPA: methyltransferase domain-containing protein, partial [Pyrinomonadaceae bacterium]|nr:methyltransferase domain-containing protein [Pyrinomonadaceae bacterium]